MVASDDPAELVPLEEVERRYILRVLEAVGGNQTLAARILGLDRKTLYRKLHRGESEDPPLAGPARALRPHYTFAVRAVHLRWRTATGARGTGVWCAPSNALPILLLALCRDCPRGPGTFRPRAICAAAAALTNENLLLAGAAHRGLLVPGGGAGMNLFVYITEGHYLFNGLTAEAEMCRSRRWRAEAPAEHLAEPAPGLHRRALERAGRRRAPGHVPVHADPHGAALGARALSGGKGDAGRGAAGPRGHGARARGGLLWSGGPGLVLPLGVRAHARIPLTANAGIQLEAFAFRVSSARSAMFTVGLVGNPLSSRPGGGS